MARRQGRKIDFKSWVPIFSISLVISSDSTVQGAAVAFTGPGTILRCRGRILVALDESHVLGDKAKLAVGLGITSTDAFNAGAGSMPDPASDVDYPWLFWDEVHLNATAAADDQAFGGIVREIMVDSKAMRKVKPGEALSWVVQYADIVGTPVMDVMIGQTRVLIGV